MRSTPERTQIHLVAVVNPPPGRYAENWRHPLSRQDWLDARLSGDPSKISRIPVEQIPLRHHCVRATIP